MYIVLSLPDEPRTAERTRQMMATTITTHASANAICFNVILHLT